MPRLFVAIRPPAPIRDALIDTMEAVDSARWQDDEQLHLTLRFVGDIERPMANDLAEALSEIAHPAFDLRVSGVGSFERGGRGRSTHALWARVPLAPELEALRQKVERACELAGLPRESRRFTPHITLARLNRSSGGIRGWLATFGDLAAGPWRVDDFVLYQSHLGSGGAYYEPIARYPLTA